MSSPTLRRSELAHSPAVPAMPARSLPLALWRLADPKIALASVVPFCVGLSLIHRAGGNLDLGIAIGAFLAIFLVEAGKNAVNDLYDFRSGADQEVRDEERSPYSGGKRVLVDHLVTEHDLVLIAWIAFLLAGVTGAAVALVSRPALLLLGAVAAIISVLYAMPPVRLSYRGLGELAVFAVYGPGILLGTVLLFGGAIDRDAIAIAIQLGFLIALVLLMNEFPDERADRMAGKKTLVVRLGRKGATNLAGLMFVAALTVPLALAAFGGSFFPLAGWIAAPIAAFAFWKLLTQPSGPPVQAQAATLVTYAVTGFAIALAATFF